MGDGMKKEKIIIIILLSLLIITCLIIFIKNYLIYSNRTTITNNPFKYLEIMNQKIEIKDNQKTYEQEINCLDLEENEQIINYTLNDDFTNAKVKVNTIVYKDNEIIKENYNEATNIDIIISITSQDYEQVFNFKNTCKITNTQEE